MNIINITEYNVAVSIVSKIFKPTIFDIFIGLSVQFWSSIVDNDAWIINQILVIISRLTQLNEHLFVFHLAVVH